MIHLEIQEMILEAAPHIEVVNHVRLKDVGSKLKGKIDKLKNELKVYGADEEVKEIED